MTTIQTRFIKFLDPIEINSKFQISKFKLHWVSRFKFWSFKVLNYIDNVKLQLNSNKLNTSNYERFAKDSQNIIFTI